MTWGADVRTRNLARRVLAALKRQPVQKIVALQKRDMARQLQTRGLSRSKARRASVEHFKKPACKEATEGQS